MARTVKSVAGIIQYIKSAPTDSLSKSFLAQFEHQLSGQKNFWASKGKEFIKRERDRFSKEFKSDPDLAHSWEQGTAGLFEDAPVEPQAPQHPQDSEAVQWAKANPSDPRAQKILQANGVK
jgi:hypothetical protein